MTQATNLQTWPERIWLQHGDDGDPIPAFESLQGVTWCQNNINGSDIEYVRADVAKPLAESVASHECGSVPDVRFVSAVSGMQYTNRGAAGEVAAVIIDGEWFGVHDMAEQFKRAVAGPQSGMQPPATVEQEAIAEPDSVHLAAPTETSTDPSLNAAEPVACTHGTFGSCHECDPERFPFPPRDPSKPAEQQGIFHKFSVKRVDGSDQPGGKHYGCRYFVLDLAHDRAAPAAMYAYAAKIADTHPQLAQDIQADVAAYCRSSDQSGISSLDRRPNEQNAVQLSAQTAEPVAQGECDCQNPEPESGAALVSNECPIHNLNPRISPQPRPAQSPALADIVKEAWKSACGHWLVPADYDAPFAWCRVNTRQYDKFVDLLALALLAQRQDSEQSRLMLADDTSPRIPPSQDSDKDAAILNWLEVNPGFELEKFITWRNGAGEYDGVERTCWRFTTGDDDDFEGSTLREAITAAIANGAPT